MLSLYDYLYSTVYAVNQLVVSLLITGLCQELMKVKKSKDNDDMLFPYVYCRVSLLYCM